MYDSEEFEDIDEDDKFFENSNAKSVIRDNFVAMDEQAEVFTL